jgi:hypothetical protein
LGLSSNRRHLGTVECNFPTVRAAMPLSPGNATSVDHEGASRFLVERLIGQAAEPAALAAIGEDS